MKRVHPVLVFLLLVLGGCGAPRNLSPFVHEPLDAASAALQGDQALIIVGFSTDLPGELLTGKEPSSASWIQIEPETRVRKGLERLEWKTNSGIATPRMAKGGTGYHLFVAPAGTYALGWFQRSFIHFYFPTEFKSVDMLLTNGQRFYAFSREALTKESAPTFTVNPGEIIYVGDLVLRWSNNGMYWSTQQSEDGVSKFLEEKGIKGRPAVRPMRRADGAPFTANDGAPERVIR